MSNTDAPPPVLLDVYRDTDGLEAVIVARRQEEDGGWVVLLGGRWVEWPLPESYTQVAP
jgi:hypothetical protein